MNSLELTILAMESALRSQRDAVARSERRATDAAETLREQLESLRSMERNLELMRTAYLINVE